MVNKIIDKRQLAYRSVGKKLWQKTYNSGDSLVITHPTTNPPIYCSYMAERTGSIVVSSSFAIKRPKFSV